MIIDLRQVASMDLSGLYHLLDPANLFNMTEFFKAPNENYKLLAYLSTLFNYKFIFEIGSFAGHSALALSFNPTNTVISFDVNDGIYLPIKDERPNIRFLVGDYIERLTELLISQLIFIDASHDGKQELALYNLLRRYEYSGLLLIDDIYNDDVYKFWMAINSYPKYDLTKWGHSTGVGLIDFSSKCLISE